MRHTIVLAILLLTGYFSNNLIAQNSSLLTISVYESLDKGYNKIIVIENDKKIEELELSTFYYKDLESHLIATNKIIIKYKEIGYKIVSEIRGTVGLGVMPVMVTTFRLEK